MMMQVTMPADALDAIATPSSLAETTVDAGFSTSDFTVSAPFSSGDINILGLSAGSLHIQTSGYQRPPS
ncbi:hypothetical protein CVIRNUC_000781 [Coccomyxa viridis]|uniref:Uncharacterized protein n=1 Tax=Coccomyxa viridis TaxID=1274662 RepID=A0AAV1HRB1_9CHLO|nr:hypothetical protein CVIRNUC_000781 [Coccomyxa viridis]